MARLQLNFWIWSIFQLLYSSVRTTSLPIVDLGYEKHAAYGYSNVSLAYTFLNIRYAAPPLGQLRFAAPKPPLHNHSTVQTGEYGPQCYQSVPSWELARANSSSSSSPGATNYEAEDCLFLDVVVPKQVFERKVKKAPVLVWIYGGGYVAGSKDAYTKGAGGLIEAGDDRVIYVAMNYRLGAFGWSSGPSFQASGGIANVGLYDQRFALEWVQKYIHLFGGDCSRVTVMGESAGGGSIMHHITAYAGLKGNGTSPFAQAIPQSPGWFFIVGHFEQETIYYNYLVAAGCLPSNMSILAASLGPINDGLECLRKQPTAVLQRANLITVYLAPYGQFTYGPVVDGIYAPDLPGSLLAQGAFDHNISLLIGHNSNEGFGFTNPAVNTSASFDLQLSSDFPSAASIVRSFVSSILYPPPSPLTPYSSDFQRLDLLISESVFTCNTVYLAHAFENKTHNYLFSVPPGTHGSDVVYTFFNMGEVLANNTIAEILQSYILEFVMTGNPNNKGAPYFGPYGKGNTVLNLNVTGVGPLHDPASNRRCSWWQKALYV